MTARPKPATTTAPTHQGGQGFKRITSTSFGRNLFWSTCGKEYAGKSRFGLTFPDPIAYMATDPGCVRAVESMCDQKDIRLKIYPLPETVLKENPNRMVDGKKRLDATIDFDQYKDLYNEWLSDWDALLSDPEIKTIIVDTGKDIWDVLRGARHGKLIQIPPQEYTNLNLEFGATLRKATRALGGTKNIIWIDKMSKQYSPGEPDSQTGKRKNEWNGKWERSGFGDIGYIAEVTLEHFTLGGVFGARFGLKSGPNKSLIGAEYMNDPDMLEVWTAEKQAKAMDAGREDWEEVVVSDVCTYEFLMGELYGS